MEHCNDNLSRILCKNIRHGIRSGLYHHRWPLNESGSSNLYLVMMTNNDNFHMEERPIPKSNHQILASFTTKSLILPNSPLHRK